uniref:Rho-GAP domain-containing protein n=1 Tax=Arcella intermedia TaxID=1963864 RepID=A0A6B2L702_9EUKA
MEFQACSGITSNVPLIVQHCVHCLSSKLDEEGIFRKSGLHSDINNWKESLDNGVPIHTLITEQSDCHSITGLLKLYFRELPSPLIEESYHEEFFKIVKLDVGDEEKIDALKNTIEKMGVYERDLFKYLCQLLRQVARRHEYNKMTVPNLARIWAPNLVWSRAISSSDSMKSIEFNHNSERLMKILIAESEYLTDTLTVEPVTFFMLTEPFNPAAELEDSSEVIIKPSPKRRCAKPAPSFSLTESPGIKPSSARPPLPDTPPVPPKFDECASTTELNVYSNPSCTESLSATVPFSCTQTLQSPEKPDCSETEYQYLQSKRGKILLTEYRLSQPKVSVRKPLCATSSASQTEDLSTISGIQTEDVERTEPFQ